MGMATRPRQSQPIFRLYPNGTEVLVGPGECFVRIPLWWIRRCYTLSPSALVLGLELWFQAGLQKTATVRVSKVKVPHPGDPRARQRGLVALEQAGLITVVRHSGQASLVTLVEDEPQ
jgi:hypothetical protein